MDLAVRCRRCQLGSMHGPMNHESINGTHSALLAAHRCNSDVQLPYRFPIIPESHCCTDETCLKNSDKLMIEATQMAQQAGYACDYCTKRQPMAFNEVKECCKGHQTLGEHICREPVNRIGKRHATRIMSDAYGRGIVRAQVENTNLRAYSTESDVTAAESIKTCKTEAFYGHNSVDIVQNLNDKHVPGTSTVFAEVDMRSKRHRKITFRDVATFCGERPRDDRVWYLSPYEFVSEWEVVMLSYPQYLPDAYNPRHHAELTPEGIAKIHAHPGRHPDLLPGIDYRVKEGGDSWWMPFPDISPTEHFRHTWIIMKRHRPVAPMFIGSPVPLKQDSSAERSAMLTMAYFHPWTLRHNDEEESYVPYAGSLRASDSTWQDALSQWLDGHVISQ